MNTLIDKILSLSIPTGLITHEQEKYRAYTIVGMNFLFAAICLLITVLINLEIIGESDFPYTILLALVIGSILAFKNIGSFILSGNLTTLAIYVCSFPLALKTGGLYSHDLITLLLIPIVAFLLADKLSGWVWVGIITLSILTCYTLAVQDSTVFYRGQTLLFPPEYYLIGLVTLLFASCFTVYIFKIGQLALTKELISQKKKLISQKEQLVKQSKIILKEQAEKEEAQVLLKKSNLALEQYAYVVSHDLKQPLRSVTSFSELILAQLENKGMMDDKLKEYFGFVLDSTDDMKHLIEDVLEYAKIEYVNTDDNLEPLCMEKCIDRAMLHLRDNITKNNIDINVIGEMPMIEGIQIQLIQLIQNLISNAIKFRKMNAPCNITIKVEKDKYWKFAISDNGIGIPENKINDIFQPFRKFSNRKGTGIGLATCKKILDNHKGEIWATSEEMIGTTIYFTIPIATTEAHPAPAAFSFPKQVNVTA